VITAAQIIRLRRARKARQREKQARNRFWLAILLALVFLLVVIPVGVTMGASAYMYLMAIRHLPDPQTALTFDSALGATELYDRSGTVLLLSEQGSAREWVSLATLPSHVLQATLLAEDRNFMSATGFSLTATLAHLWENALFGPLQPDRTLVGRLVRNTLAPLPEIPTADDMGREIALVAEIKRRYTLEQILEWHLNTNDYGNQIYGIGSAAQIYLGKDATQITLDEAALLAAIPLATQYNPFDNEIAARGRQLDLLRAMRAAGQITAGQFDQAASIQTPVQLAIHQEGQIAPEFTAYARRQAQDILDAQGRDGAQLVTRGNLKIITTLDLDLYYQSECALRTQIGRLSGQSDPVNALDGNPCQTAVYMPPVSAARPANAVPDTGALVVMDVATGEIKSLVGAATRMAEQPGPTLTPFVYFTGFRSGQYNPARMVLDIPRQFPGAQEGLIYTPTNPDGQFHGPINLRDALSAWLRPPTVQVANAEGMEDVLRFAHRIGLNSLGETGNYDLSLLERGGAVSVLDMTYAYAVFAALGDMHGVPAQSIGPGFRQRNPVAVLRIEDGQGNLIWQYDDSAVQQNRVPVFPPELGYLVTDILADQTRRRVTLGESASILDLQRRSAVVSGLTGDLSGSWTVGYTPQLATGAHLGRADSGQMTLDPFGLQGAAVVWRAIMQYTHERDRLPPADWQRPETVIQLPVCDRSGLLANGICPTRSEIFISGFTPDQPDTYWTSVEINSQNGLLASTSTPAQFRVSKLFFQPPAEAREWWESNNLELPPTQFDTISRPDIFSATQILQPQPFAYVGGVVDIRGTLDPADLQYFQLAYGAGPSPTSFIQIGEPQTRFNRGASIGLWDTGGLSGLYTLVLRVVRNDNTADSALTQVIIDNTPPTIVLDAGEPGRIYRWPAESSLTLTATTSDDYTLDRVEFYHNGQYLGSDTEAPYGFTWEIEHAGTETFAAVAFDAVGNQSNSEAQVEIVRN
jgi:membrane peptidoglycan carboxypeptidase